MMKNAAISFLLGAGAVAGDCELQDNQLVFFNDDGSDVKIFKSSDNAVDINAHVTVDELTVTGKGTFSQLVGRVVALESKNVQDKGDIGTLQTDVGTLQTDVSTLKTSSSQARTDLDYILGGNPIQQKFKSFRVEGDTETFYPVLFDEGCWWNMRQTISINKASVHSDVNSIGSMTLRFSFHTTNWGHGSSYWDYFYAHGAGAATEFFGGFTLPSIWTGAIIYMRGGYTYKYASTCPTTPKMRDAADMDTPITLKDWGVSGHDGTSVGPRTSVMETVKLGWSSSHPSYINDAAPAAPRFQDFVVEYEAPNFSYPGQEEEVLWNNECKGHGPPVHFNDVGNSEDANSVVMTMSKNVAIKSYAAQTRTHPGASYFGNSKIYGSNDKSTWIELGQITGEGMCTNISPAPIYDRTPYGYFKVTFYGNARSTYESASHIIVDLA